MLDFWMLVFWILRLVDICTQGTAFPCNERLLPESVHGEFVPTVKHSILRSYPTVGSKQLEHGCRMIYAGCPSGLGLEDNLTITFQL